ncbi:hypothetical protein [uncultured Paracoccus sp.]|uniref:hypothetical protein n=1 Tax=uncultured Paracoccus sp. TaxID=189685 RepID=UPI0025ECC156|nr:hypothetical protein [uncultured Paracoccus sp.]
MRDFLNKPDVRAISDLEHYLLNVRELVVKGAPIKDFWTLSEFYLDRAKQNNFVSPEIQKLSVGGYLGVLANKADDFIDGSLGIQNSGFLDKVTDILTAPVHAAGQVIDGIARAGTAVGQGF